MAQSFFFKFTPFSFQIPVKKYHFLPAIFVKSYFVSDFEWIFSMVVFGIVVAVTVAVATGRRAGKKVHLFILWAIIPQRKHVFFIMPGETYFFLPFS